jgi:hypothetical protein
VGPETSAELFGAEYNFRLTDRPKGLLIPVNATAFAGIDAQTQRSRNNEYPPKILFRETLPSEASMRWASTERF